MSYQKDRKSKNNKRRMINRNSNRKSKSRMKRMKRNNRNKMKNRMRKMRKMKSRNKSSFNRQKIKYRLRINLLLEIRKSSMKILRMPIKHKP